MATQIERFCQVADQELQVMKGSSPKEWYTAEYRPELCRSLGLDTQAKFVSAADDVAAASRFYPMMPDYQLAILSRFLPTVYSRRQGHWKGYQFDVMPVRVLEDIQLAASLEIFNDLEIWTPEKQVDPVAVGVIGNPWSNWRRQVDNVKFFLIVRWGESLKPFSQIEREVLGRVVINGSSDVLNPKVKARVIKDLMDMEGEVVRSGETVFRKHCEDRMYTYAYFSFQRYTKVRLCKHCAFSIRSTHQLGSGGPAG